MKIVSDEQFFTRKVKSARAINTINKILEREKLKGGIRTRWASRNGNGQACERKRNRE